MCVYIEREGAVGVLNSLHHGEHAGSAWRLLIDTIAIVLIAMSAIRFLRFLSLRFRLRTALALMTTSLAVRIGVFVFAAV